MQIKLIESVDVKRINRESVRIIHIIKGEPFGAQTSVLFMSAFTGEYEKMKGSNEYNVAFHSTLRTLVNSLDMISHDVSESSKWEGMCAKTADSFDLHLHSTNPSSW